MLFEMVGGASLVPSVTAVQTVREQSFRCKTRFVRQSLRFAGGYGIVNLGSSCERSKVGEIWLWTVEMPLAVLET